MKHATAIPHWNTSGIMPPIRPGELGHSAARSPYRASLLEIIDRFGTSAVRISILQGYLNFREQLHVVGLSAGIQWLDGSFVENKETRRGVAPADIDVITFAYLPDERTQLDIHSLNPDLFDNAKTKATYKVDSYFQILGKPSDGQFVRQTSYWNSMWSHTRQYEWKGFLEVDLSPEQDTDARTYLSEIQSQL